ncbi:uncharacterized protein LOC121389812 [Gigantopelta aegis]|uniref:uncharacterized protein LOC121389812 n=1 Tax=Gigantopelta aegis TaxID=1735272 RepID=UPI001B88B36D|nr:uncharacterized protein LOC121389812 [Gigantopelta aegis]
MPRLTNVQHERAVRMLQKRNVCRKGMFAETSVADVARALGYSQWVIYDLRARVQQTSITADRPRPGRPRMTSQADDRHIVLRYLRNHFMSATAKSNELFRRRVSTQTIRNRLRTAHLHARRPYVGTILTKFNRRQRQQWAQRHLRWTGVVFCDESRFTLRYVDGRKRIWRRCGERHAQCSEADV